MSVYLYTISFNLCSCLRPRSLLLPLLMVSVVEGEGDAPGERDGTESEDAERSDALDGSDANERSETEEEMEEELDEHVQDKTEQRLESCDRDSREDPGEATPEPAPLSEQTRALTASELLLNE